MYQVSLDLSPEEVKAMRQLALDRDTSVRGLLTRLVTDELEKAKDKTKIKQKEDL